MKKNLLKRALAAFCIVALVLSVNTKLTSAESSNVTIDPTQAISVDGGQVTGISSQDDSVAIYKGIPFAAPPVGNLRWKAPQPVVAWDGVKKCTDYSASAIQSPQAPFMFWSKEFIIDTTKGYSEDCLYLNVWTKKESAVKDRPVIVYIHGGGNNSGGASCDVYDGEGIAKKDVVYVSINYRVGIFGFLALPELSAESPDKVSGNYAILDQIAALNWVKNNIAKFGGDPNNVTVAGQSAGSQDIHSLISSPLAKGLFKNAVTMSYNELTTKHVTLAQKEEEGKKAFAGKSLSDLRAMTTDQLMKTSGVSTAVCIDGKVITGDVIDTYKNGTANDVNLMTGMVAGDAAAFPVVSSGAPPFSYTKAITKDKYQAAVTAKVGPLAVDGLKAYPAASDDALSAFNLINRDGMMAQQYYLAKVRKVNSRNKTYLYYFDHTMSGPQAAEMGAFHTADVPYWLNYFSPLRESYWTNTDKKLGEMMSSYLVNFAKTGNPNGAELPKWNAYNEGPISFLNIGDSTATVQLSRNQFKLWRDFYEPLIGNVTDVVKKGYAELGDWSITRVAKDVYFIDDATRSNPAGLYGSTFNAAASMYLIVDQTKALLIDAGNPVTSPQRAADFNKLISAMTAGKTLEVAITHNHPDHIGLLSSKVIPTTTKIYFPKKDYIKTDVAGDVPELIKDYKNIQFINDNDVINTGRFNIKCLEFPGHTPGSTCFVDYEHNIIFSSDAMGSGFVYLFGDNDMISFDAGIRNFYSKVKTMKNPLILTGHTWQLNFAERKIYGPITLAYMEDMIKILDSIKNSTEETSPYRYQQGWVALRTKVGLAEICTSPKAVQIYRNH